MSPFRWHVVRIFEYLFEYPDWEHNSWLETKSNSPRPTKIPIQLKLGIPLLTMQSRVFTNIRFRIILQRSFDLDRRNDLRRISFSRAILFSHGGSTARKQAIFSRWNHREKTKCQKAYVKNPTWNLTWTRILVLPKPMRGLWSKRTNELPRFLVFGHLAFAR